LDTSLEMVVSRSVHIIAADEWRVAQRPSPDQK